MSGGDLSRKFKLFMRMRNNPKADWVIEDVQAVCSAFEVSCQPPSNGSHWTVSDPHMERILTIPARKPIKAPYIRALVKFLEERRRKQ
jgi:hypothetical protein